VESLGPEEVLIHKEPIEVTSARREGMARALTPP
jgi:hypothetical protein